MGSGGAANFFELSAAWVLIVVTVANDNGNLSISNINITESGSYQVTLSLTAWSRGQPVESPCPQKGEPRTGWMQLERFIFEIELVWSTHSKFEVRFGTSVLWSGDFEKQRRG